jgi:phosphatidylserine decarboxylase
MGQPIAGADNVPARWPLLLLAALPKHLLSRAAGWFATRHWPGPLQRWLNRSFARQYRIDAADAELPLDAYPTLQALFTRRLKLEARPLATDPSALVAPTDSTVGACGRADGDTILQVKGRPYSVEQLLGGGELSAPFRDGVYATFYLSPHDYHRIHSPIDGTVVAARYLPGRLWPVNPRSVAHIDDLFGRNERIAIFLASAVGPVALVAVGATMVGGIAVTFDDLAAPAPGTRMVERRYAQGARLRRGDEIGRFEFGSTVVLLLPPGSVELALQPGQAVCMGQGVGRLVPAGAR